MTRVHVPEFPQYDPRLWPYTVRQVVDWETLTFIRHIYLYDTDAPPFHAWYLDADLVQVLAKLGMQTIRVVADDAGAYAEAPLALVLRLSAVNYSGHARLQYYVPLGAFRPTTEV
ncbi:MAG: hypothetical protein BWY76_00013 [bacterium ADurb.Bin429]|nr:MAG: hypothetical protein BWY76_00013 [bacterium ADurb.Bin429]